MKLNNYKEFNSNIGYSVEEVSNILNITEKKVRELELSAIRKLRHPRSKLNFNQIIDTYNGLYESAPENLDKYNDQLIKEHKAIEYKD